MSPPPVATRKRGSLWVVVHSDYITYIGATWPAEKGAWDTGIARTENPSRNSKAGLWDSGRGGKGERVNRWWWCVCPLEGYQEGAIIYT